MSTLGEEASICQRVDERPSAELGKVRQLRARDHGYHFIAGALTSILASAVTLPSGARVGGILLALQAILAASLTLIEDHEDTSEAREDARGAVIGGYVSPELVDQDQHHCDRVLEGGCTGGRARRRAGARAAGRRGQHDQV